MTSQDHAKIEEPGNRLWRHLPFGVAGAFALALGLLLRVWFLRHAARVAGDSFVYGDIALNMIRHHAYGFTQTGAAPRPTFIRLPGYPLFLAASFLLFGAEHYMAVLRVQVAIDLWTCLLLARMARRMFGSRAGLAALWLAALCPFTANFAATGLTETLTLFCIALAFYALLRWQECGAGFNRWLYCVAFALGYAILLRPEQGMLAAAVVPAIFWLSPGASMRKLKPALLTALLTLLQLTPWTARNWHTFHVFQPLAPRFANDPGEYNPAGFERWYRTWAIDFSSTEQVYWNYDGNLISIHDLPSRAFDSSAQYADTQALLNDYNVDMIVTPALDRRFDALARERIQDHPLRYYIAMPVGRVFNMTFRPRLDFLEIPLQWWKGHARTVVFAVFYGALNLAYFVLAAIGLARHRLWQPHRVIVCSMLATIAFRIALLLTIDNSETRYTLEFFPVLIVLGAACFATPDPSKVTDLESSD